MGEKRSCVKLGEIFFEGSKVVENLSKCIHYFQMAADLGDTFAMLRLGQMYLLGGQMREKRCTIPPDKEVRGTSFGYITFLVFI